MGSEWPRGHGVQLARCLPTAHASGLSAPLREMLLSVVDFDALFTVNRKYRMIGCEPNRIKSRAAIPDDTLSDRVQISNRVFNGAGCLASHSNNGRQ
jgi:hypothetical protein